MVRYLRLAAWALAVGSIVIVPCVADARHPSTPSQQNFIRPLQPAAAAVAAPLIDGDLNLESVATIPEVPAEYLNEAVTQPAPQERASAAFQVPIALPAAVSPIKRLADRIASRTSVLAAHVTRAAMRYIGTPYIFGGTSARGFDCSGYVQHVFANVGIHLPRTADAQFFVGHRIPSGKMTRGDLVFFQTYAPGPSHVGIYVGSGQFVHSSSHGVMVSKLSQRYWSRRYLGAKRVVAVPVH